MVLLLVVLTARAHAAPADGVDEVDDRAAVRADGADPMADAGDVDVPYSVSLDDRAARFDGPCDCDAPTLARIAAGAPSLSAIVARAQDVAGLGSGGPVRGWRRRSRWSALIPYVSVRAGSGQSWRDVLDPGLAAASSSAGEPTTLNHSLSYDVRLGWRLDHLLYDPNEPRLTAFELARRRDRRKIAALASRAYFVWLRASVAVERDARWQLRLAEATAELDALTDAWFSERLAERADRRESR
ncbi:MAG TPA: hypothetical protein VL326_21980 [Kofleriaceae bacterium]|nr:hypothetical protein [Kofleriaceae bacterium]